MQKLINVIMRYYRYQGKIFVYLTTSADSYSGFYTNNELETLLKDHTLQVQQLKLFGCAQDLINNAYALEEFAKIIYAVLCDF